MPSIISWNIRMAWRDSRRNTAKLLLFVSSVAIGIAALTGTISFRHTLLQEIDLQAKELLGSDFVVSSTKPLADSLFYGFAQISQDVTNEASFASMAYFPRTDGARLVQIKALSKGGYPYYGDIKTSPKDASISFRGSGALVDEKLMLQYGVTIGDSVRVGNAIFSIHGAIQRLPGQSDIGSGIAPVVMIPYDSLAGTGLIQLGSRVNYASYFMLKSESDTAQIWSALVKQAAKAGFDVDTVAERKERTGRSFRDMTEFLQLIAFTALILGCLGIAGAVHVYIKSKIQQVAILLCLGMKIRQAYAIFLIQIAFFGLLGGLFGSLLGYGIYRYLPIVAAAFIPVSFTSAFYWPAAWAALGLGVTISILFGLLSIVKLRRLSPLAAIRTDLSGVFEQKDYLQWLISALIGALIYLGMWLLSGKALESLIQFGVIAGTLIFLYLLSLSITFLLKKIIPLSLPYVWRQGLSNLYRPGNQTIILLITLGLGTTFLAMMYFMQDLLVKQVSISGAGDRPNTVLFDIQKNQVAAVRQMTEDYDLPVLQEVPIVTMRLLEINGRKKEEFLADSVNKVPEWAFSREYRVTYRDSLIASEKITSGSFQSKINGPSDTIFISVASGLAESLKLKLGDELTFNVQGALMKTYVGSFREVDWRRVQTNFLVVFPAGVLEKAPQFYVLITRTGRDEKSARYQRAIVRMFPNVSVIDLELILRTVEEVLGKVTFVIRFMAVFSIATGIMVMLSALMLSKYQRVKENALLRMIGASKRQLWAIMSAEYLMLGLLGSMAGVFLASIITILLGKFAFEFNFLPSWTDSVMIILSISSLTLFTGLLNSRKTLNYAPLEVLREES